MSGQSEVPVLGEGAIEMDSKYVSGVIVDNNCRCKKDLQDGLVVVEAESIVNMSLVVPPGGHI